MPDKLTRCQAAADTARRAAGYMSEHGHCKGKLRDSEGRVCFAGALVAAEHESAQAALTYDTVAFRIGLIRDTASRLLAGGNAVSWNNLPETTGEEVILLLKRCAEELDDDAGRAPGRDGAQARSALAAHR